MINKKNYECKFDTLIVKLLAIFIILNKGKNETRSIIERIL